MCVDATDAILSVQSVSKSYATGVAALDSVSMVVRPGEIVALVGPNGAGKTTLLEIIEGIRTPDKGSVTVFGESAGRLSYDIRRRIGAQLQGFRGFRHHSVSDLLSILLTAYQSKSGIGEVLDEFDLTAERTRQFGQLSGGERQRVALAAAACGGPRLLLLDEPTSDMDPEFRRFVWNFLADRSSTGVATLFSTHQIGEVSQYCHRAIVMNGGRIVADGTIDELTRDHADVTKLEITWTGHVMPDALHAVAGNYQGSVDPSHRRVRFVMSGFSQVSALLNELRSLRGLAVRADQGTLEDVYFKLMGQ